MFYTMIRELSVPYLLGFDPQIYESMPLAVAAGANLVLIYRDLPRHKEVPLPRTRAGVFYRWLQGDFQYVARTPREHRLGNTSVLRSLRPRLNAVHNNESLKDPGPMVARLHLLARSR